LIICNYISLLHYPNEKLDNWHVGITSQKDTDGKTDHLCSDIDISTWKEFRVKDDDVAREIVRMLRDNRFDTEELKNEENKANVIYVFRKKS